MPKANPILKAADPWLKWLIIAGTMTYFVETSMKSTEGDRGHSIFWWVQSLIAICFIIEYILRWLDDAQDHYRWHYPQSALGIVDLLSILPFWIGCFLPLELFQLLRTLRVFLATQVLSILALTPTRRSGVLSCLTRSSTTRFRDAHYRFVLFRRYL